MAFLGYLIESGIDRLLILRLLSLTSPPLIPIKLLFFLLLGLVGVFTVHFTVHIFLLHTCHTTNQLFTNLCCFTAYATYASPQNSPNINDLHAWNAFAFAFLASCRALYSVHIHISPIHFNEVLNRYLAYVSASTIQNKIVLVDWRQLNHVLLLFSLS